MKFVSYIPQSKNPNKHPLMPDQWVWMDFKEQDDNTQPSEDHVVMPLDAYNALKVFLQPQWNQYRQNELLQEQTVNSVRSRIKNAIDFGNNLIIDFATENVLMGITQQGKTSQVADYLQSVMRYAQTGSLYAVINEINTLIFFGIPENLAPFVTEQRLILFKNKVEAYLGIL